MAVIDLGPSRWSRMGRNLGSGVSSGLLQALEEQRQREMQKRQVQQQARDLRGIMDAFQQVRTQEGGQQGTLQSVLDIYQPQTRPGMEYLQQLVTPDNELRTLGPGDALYRGTERIAHNPKARDLSAKQKEIRRYKKLFGVDDKTAVKWAEGLIEVSSRKDPLGYTSPVLVDKTTGTEVPITASQARKIKREQARQEGAGGQGGSRTPDTQGKDVRGKKAGYITPDTAERGTGVTSNLKQAWNNLFGWMSKGVPFEDTAEARNALRTFNHNAIQALVVNPRAPVAEQRTIKNFLPDPDTVLKDPDEARQQIGNLRNFLENQIQNKQKAIQSGRISADQYKTYTDQINNIKTVLDLMGESGGSGTARTFEGMSRQELSNINIDDLSDEELEAFLRATDEMMMQE